MRDLLILPKQIDAADKPPPKETAQRAAPKTNPTEPFQHVFEQSKKMVQKRERKAGSKGLDKDTEETAQSTRAEKASSLASPATQSETVTLPVNHPDNDPIQPNTGSEGKEGDKDEKISLNNVAIKPAVKNQDSGLILLADEKIILTDGVSRGASEWRMVEDKGKQHAPTSLSLNVNEKQDIPKTNHSVDTATLMDMAIASVEKELSEEVKKPQTNLSNISSNSTSGTPQPDEEKNGKINPQIIPEEDAKRNQSTAGTPKGGNLGETSVNTQAAVNKTEIPSQPQSSQISQTPLQNGEPRSAESNGDRNSAKEAQKISGSNDTGSQGQKESAIVDDPKLNNLSGVGSNHLEQRKASGVQTSETAPFEESIAGKVIGKSKEDAPADNIQTGVSQPLLPQNKTNEPARLAEAPRNEVIQQLSKDLESFTKSGQQSLRLQLHPESLGKIDLHLTSNAEGVRIVMNADQAATGFLLERHLGELKEMLEQAGVNLTGLSVNAGNAQLHSNGNFQNSPFHSAGFSPKSNPLTTNQEKKALSSKLKMDRDSRVDYRI
ncbi:MAG: flagellar hook-length control protein FliK [Anaerolineales bacterium]